MRRRDLAVACAGLLAGCASGQDATLSETNENLTGCNGVAASGVPSDGNYYLTTFGNGASDNGQMSCGQYTQTGSWYYAASRQRYGCGARLRIEANGKCVVAEADDYGPDVCVEDAAGGPIMDASPLVAQQLFGRSSAGWSDHFRVHVTQVSGSTPLGPCQGGSSPTDPTGCSVQSDGKLHCSNNAGAALYSSPSFSASVVNYLRTTYSWFDCSSTGDYHTGGNRTWYHTVGDDNSNSGWTPAANLNTSSSFDANPSAQGLRQCGGGSSTDPACSVHSDGRLYCSNSAGAPLYSSPNSSSSVVNHLRTTSSWFDCWSTGGMHAGGNTTWYHTLGDDNGNWGWTPGVNLNTSSSFDTNPSSQGLPACR